MCSSRSKVQAKLMTEFLRVFPTYGMPTIKNDDLCRSSSAALKPAPATYFLLPGKEWNYIIFSHNGQHVHVNQQSAPSLY